MLGNFERFAKTTSLKGVPRAVNNDTVFLRTLWISAIVIFLGFCAWQVTMLIIQYFQYPVIQTRKLEMMDYDDPAVYPRITLCNMVPTESFYKEYRVVENGPFTGVKMTEIYDLYDDLLHQNTKCGGNCTEEDEYMLEMLFQELSGNLGFNQFIGVELMQELGHKEDTFVVSCSVAFKKGIVDVYLPCDGTINMTQVFSPTLGNCYGIDMPMYSDLSSVDFPNGLSFILYLDNLYYEEDFYFDEHAAFSTIGATLELNPKNKRAFMSEVMTGLKPAPSVSESVRSGYDSAINGGHMCDVTCITAQTLEPRSQADIGQPQTHPKHNHYEFEFVGTHTVIDYSVHIFEDMEPPHGHCSSSDDADDYGAYCIYKCATEALHRLCGCTYYQYGTFLDVNDSYPFCGNVSLSWDTLLHFYKCVGDHKALLENYECPTKCKYQCKEYGFIVDKYDSTWPTFGALNAFWETMMSKPPVRAKLEPYFIWKNQTENYRTEKEIKQTIVNENFLRVTIKLGSLFRTYTKTTPKLNFASMLSSVGAAMNFWSGMTVVILVEAIEMCYRTWAADSDKKKTGKKQDIFANKVHVEEKGFKY